MKRYIAITIILIAAISFPGNLYSEKIDFGLWFLNSGSGREKIYMTKPDGRKVIILHENIISIPANTRIFHNSDFSLNYSINILNDVHGIRTPLIHGFDNFLIDSQLVANISLSAFDGYNLSIYSFYGHSSLSRSLQDRVFTGCYGIGLDRHFDDNILMSFSYNAYYCSPYFIPWDYKHQQKKMLDIMLKIIF